MEKALLKDVLEIMLEETRERNKTTKNTAIQANIWIELAKGKHQGPAVIGFKNRIDEAMYSGSDRARAAIFSDNFEVLQYDIKQSDQGKDGKYFFDTYNVLVRQIR